MLVACSSGTKLRLQANRIEAMLLYERAPNFETLGLSPEACDGMKRIMPGIPPGTFMSWVLPRLIAGQDLRRTVRDFGNNKTIAAYLITIFERFNKHRVSHANGGVRALILTATGDMASRTFDLAQKLFSSTDIVVVYLNGGESELERLDHLKPDVVIVTPDTLIHHLSSSAAAAADGILCLSTMGLLVIDGAYEMFRLGFADHLNKILGQLGELDRQTLFFSTQFTAEVCDLAKKILRNPLWVRPSTTYEMFDKVSSLCLGEVQEKKPCVEKPNTILQDPPPKKKMMKKKEKMMKKKKKRATDDGIEEEGGSLKKRARVSMDVD